MCVLFLFSSKSIQLYALPCFSSAYFIRIHLLAFLWAISTLSMKVESCGKLQIYCINSLHYCPEQLLTRGCRDAQIKPVGIMPGVGEWQKNANKPVRHLQSQVSLFRISILNPIVVGWAQGVNYDMIAWWWIESISRRSPRKGNSSSLCWKHRVMLSLRTMGRF